MHLFRLTAPLAMLGALLVAACLFGCSSAASSSAQPGVDDDASPADDDNDNDDSSPDDDNDDASPAPEVAWVACSEYFPPAWLLLIPPHTKCGAVPAPADWLAPNGPSIVERFAMVPGPAGAPVLSVNLGGPDPNLRNLVLYALNPQGLLWEELAPKFTLLFTEGRGSSMSSTPLVCPSSVLGQPYATQAEYQSLVYECLANLPTRLSPAVMMSSDQADDMDLVRAGLGVDQLLLYGASYGTRLMLEYLRRHGEHVTAYLLDSVLPPQSSCKDDIDRTLETLSVDCDAVDTCPFASGADLTAATNTLLNVPPADDDDDTASPHALTLDLFELCDQPGQLAMFPAALAAGQGGDWSAMQAWHAASLPLLPAPDASSTDATTFDFDPYVDNLCCNEFPGWNVFSDRTFVLDSLTPPYIPFAQIEWMTNIDCASLAQLYTRTPTVNRAPVVSAAVGLMISPRLDQRTPYPDAAAAIAAGLSGADDVTVNCNHVILTQLGQGGIGLSQADQDCLRSLAVDWLVAPFDPTTRACVNALMTPLPIVEK
jgi:pimeloyl-ACP methyl ester carboxylesterase